jgi:serine/threonine protein kinase
VLDEEGRMGTRAAAFVVTEVTLALAALHDAGIAYRNLWTENVQLDRKGHCKLARFELGKPLGSGQVDHRTFTLAAGRIGYLAPEQVLHRGHGKAVDMWALGCLLFELLTGQAPFDEDGDSGLAVLENILGGRYNLVHAAAAAKHFTPDAKDLVKCLFSIDPIRRLGCGNPRGALDIFSHPWFSPRTVDVEAIQHQKCAPPWHLQPLDSLVCPVAGSGVSAATLADVTAAPPMDNF